jgi:hypothetical protein
MNISANIKFKNKGEREEGEQREKGEEKSFFPFLPLLLSLPLFN